MLFLERACVAVRRIVRGPALPAALLIIPAFAHAQQAHGHAAARDSLRPRATAHAHADDGREAAAAVRTVRALFAAAERGDLTALDTLYAGDSLTVVEGAGINRGWRDYRDHHLAPELKEMQNFRYRPFEIEAHVQGDLAWATFRYALQATSADRTIDNLGRGTAILERRPGRWVVRHTQTSSRARRPNDPPMPQ